MQLGRIYQKFCQILISLIHIYFQGCLFPCMQLWSGCFSTKTRPAPHTQLPLPAGVSHSLSICLENIFHYCEYFKRYISHQFESLFLKDRFESLSYLYNFFCSILTVQSYSSVSQFVFAFLFIIEDSPLFFFL